MNTERNVMKWHYVTDRAGKPTGLRGWDARNEDRYEMVPEDDGTWRVSVVITFITDPDGWGFRQVGQGTVIECMVAAEANADREYAAAIEEQEDSD